MVAGRMSAGLCRVVLLAAAGAACLTAAGAKQLSGAEPAPEHWAYKGNEGAEHWGMLSPAYMACEAGSHQSPINIAMPRHARTQERLAPMYLPGSGQVLHTGHTIQVNVQAGGGLFLNGRPYVLRQFHFHDPSEHRVDGRAASMELHLVHDDARGHILVIGVLLDVGAASEGLAAIWTRLPGAAGERSSVSMINVPALLPADTHHFSYHGSLTTPPCTEGVQWIVLRDRLTLSPEQLQAFVSLVGRNARPVQPLHGRNVTEE
jgi:carbonic anhydrase